MRPRTILESQVGGTQTVTEVLSKDPTDIGICGFLDSMRSVFALNDGELRVSDVQQISSRTRTKGLSGRQ